MKKYAVVITLIGVLSLFGAVTVLTPNGGESLTRGSNYEITWTDDISEDVKIDLFQDGVFLQEITPATASNGSYTWFVPNEIFGSTFKVKISSTVMPSLHTDLSDNDFTISLGLIQVTTPNGGEQYKRGDTLNISWTDNLNEKIKIDLYSNDTYYYTLVDSTESNGSYEWTIPFNISGNFKVKIISTVSEFIYDYSDNTFEITLGTITIVSPSGGEVIEILDDFTIQWTDDIYEDVKISLYKNTLLKIDFILPSKGSFTWKFFTNDMVGGNDYKLKISSALNGSVYDESGYFTIKGTNNISGSVSGIWTESNSPYILTDSASVSTSNTLSINPGVKLYSYPDFYTLNVKGKLEAIGNYDNLIKFKGVNLNLSNSSSIDSSKIKYSVLEQNNINIPVFSKSFGTGEEGRGYSLQQTPDGGYIITGTINSDLCLIKTDVSGNQLWSKMFGASEGACGKSVKQTTDGGYIIGGTYGSELSLLKTDNSGNLTWIKFFGASEVAWSNSVQQTTDGGYIFTGSKKPWGEGHWDMWLIKTDANGNKTWENSFGGTNDDHSNSVQQTSDGGYIITGNYEISENNYVGYLIKTDINGNQEWAKYLGGSTYSNSAKQTSDGGYIIVGSYYTGTTNLYDAYLLKTDSNGNQTWRKTYGDVSHDYGYSVQLTTDGGYIIAGNTTPSDYSKVWLIKTDASGNKSWDKTFGGMSGNDFGYSVQQTSDGGYIIAGTEGNIFLGNSIYLIKTDDLGFNLSNSILSINDNSKFILQNSIIKNCRNYPISITNASPIISNNLIYNNNNGIKFFNSSPQFIINNTITNNDSIALFFDGNSDAMLINNISYGNGSYEVYLNWYDADPIFYYNDIRGGQEGFGFNSGVTYSGTYSNNIDVDPIFEDETYMLAGNSQCIDSGYPGLTFNMLDILNIPQTDLLGNPRLYYSQIDIGCYESQTSGIEGDNSIYGLALYQNYPNPFNPVTTINYSLDVKSHTNLKIYDIRGSEVVDLVDKIQDKGLHSVKFDAEKLSSGIYFYRLKINDKIVANKKMMLLK